MSEIVGSLFLSARLAECLRHKTSEQRALLKGVLEAFAERELVILVSTVAQVNFWARLIQGVGVPPAGFSSACTELHLDEYTTRR